MSKPEPADDGVPWCVPCQSWHKRPETIEEWRALGCLEDRRDFAPAEKPELKPCANCGSTATAMQDAPRWWIECDNCGMSTPTDNFGDPYKVWNTRTPQQPPDSDS